MNNEENTVVRISDLIGVIPAITGKVELVYEGEQEGPYQVAYNLVEKAFRNLFGTYFPIPETKKKRGNQPQDDNPFRSIIAWFDNGNAVNMLFNTRDAEKVKQLQEVEGLQALVKKLYPQGSEKEKALLMEFVLHGLASYSLISKKVLEARVEFADLMGSMLNLGQASSDRDDEDLDEDNFR